MNRGFISNKLPHENYLSTNRFGESLMKCGYCCARIFSRCLFLCITMFTATASTQVYRFLHGKVVTEKAAPVKDALISFPAKNISALSDSAGSFVLPVSHTDTGTVHITRAGFEPLVCNIRDFPQHDSCWVFMLKEKALMMQAVVITGTLSMKYLTDAPVKTDLITESEIRTKSYRKLTDALFEQPGITVSQDVHGKGVQMRGLDPAYTLILVDGEPVIGRTTGIIELSRFDAGNIRQVEIIKEPASSLYGSEALAGVINLITKTPQAPLEFSAKSMYGTNNTIDGSAGIGFASYAISGDAYLAYSSSDGYRLNETDVSLTAPKFSSITATAKVEYKPVEGLDIKFSLRNFSDTQNNFASVLVKLESVKVNDNTRVHDNAAVLSVENSFSSSFKGKLRIYTTEYKNNNELHYSEGDSIYSTYAFRQRTYKGDMLLNMLVSDKSILTAGGGFISDAVTANYISSSSRQTTSSFYFAQHEWMPSPVFDGVLGLRYDMHKDYASRFSPKVSSLISPIKDKLKIRVSIATGFKAPDMQALYLNWTNPQTGYSVFGTENVKEAYEHMLAEGRIAQTLIKPDGIAQLRPENSVSFNAGVDLIPLPDVSISIDCFRNNISDLIETIPIAVKTNGQSVYSYFNINKIFTQGFELSLSAVPVSSLNVRLSYQFLDAEDEQVLDKIAAGTIYRTTAAGGLHKVTKSEYGGLFNRSKHSGSISITYTNVPLAWTANLSGVARGKYGYGDVNGNGILDEAREYVAGYVVWNAAFSKELFEHADAVLRIENIFSTVNKEYIPSLSGRLWYAGVRIQW